MYWLSLSLSYRSNRKSIYLGGEETRVEKNREIASFSQTVLEIVLDWENRISRDAPSYPAIPCQFYAK